MSQKMHINFFIFVAYSFFFVLLVWFGFKYLLPWFLPFLLAFATAGLIEPAVIYFSKFLGYKRKISAVLCSLLILISISGIFILAVSRLTYEITAFAKSLPLLLGNMTSVFSGFNEKIYNFITAAPLEIQAFLADAINGVIEKSAELPGDISARLLAAVSSAISAAPKLILFIVTYAIGTIFISMSYPDIKSFVLRQLPEKFHAKASSIKAGLLTTFGQWIRAELLLMLITFAELTAAFIILRIDYPLLLGAVTALVDALPVLGIGTVLLPWAVYAFISGNTRRAGVLIALYLIIVTVRSFLEPKIVGKHIGLHPVATLAAVYIGYACMGFAGMLLLPICITLVKQLNDLGYISVIK